MRLDTIRAAITEDTAAIALRFSTIHELRRATDPAGDYVWRDKTWRTLFALPVVAVGMYDQEGVIIGFGEEL
jgi:hypothetical protein